MTPEEFRAYQNQVYANDLRDIAATDAGKRFFARLFKGTRCLDGIYAKSADVYSATAKQAVGINIWRDLHVANPEASMAIFDDLMTPLQETQDDGSTY